MNKVHKTYNELSELCLHSSYQMNVICQLVKCSVEELVNKIIGYDDFSIDEMRLLSEHYKLPPSLLFAE